MKKDITNFTDAYLKIIKEDADEVEQMQKENALNQTVVKDMDKNDKSMNDEMVEEDVSPKDAFLNKINDLIDRVFQVGIDAGTTGKWLSPYEDEEVKDILGSIEADYDNGKAI